MIPDSVWKAEPQHREIWKKNGSCACGKPRDMMCKFCSEPMCTGCLSAHVVKEHRRDAYIERLALTDSSELWYTATPEERQEAIDLRNRWEAEDEENEKAMKVEV